jgi:hypothetical protein
MASQELSAAVPESFETSVEKASTWSGAVLALPSTTGWVPRTMATRTRGASRNIVTRPALVLNEVAALGYLLSQYIVLVPGDEHQLVILDSIGDGICYSTETGSPHFAQLWTIESDVLITSSDGVPVMSPTKNNTVHRIPNDFSIAISQSQRGWQSC